MIPFFAGMTLSSIGTRTQLLIQRVQIELRVHAHRPVGRCVARRAQALQILVADMLLAEVADGLLKYVPQARICELIRTLPIEEVGAALIEAARLPSGALWDDVAVIIVVPDENAA